MARRRRVSVKDKGAIPCHGCAGSFRWGPFSFGPSSLPPVSRCHPPVTAIARQNAIPNQPVPSRPVAANHAATALTTPGTAIARNGPVGTHFGAGWAPGRHVVQVLVLPVRFATAAACSSMAAFRPPPTPVAARARQQQFLPPSGNDLQINCRVCKVPGTLRVPLATAHGVCRKCSCDTY